jgi:hypothetical protein
MERHCTNYVHLHNAPYFSCPIINQHVKLLRNCNTHESMSLHDCKEYAQVNDLPKEMKKNMLHKKMKTTCNCECMLYKCFKSKWNKCYCIDKYIDISNINILQILQGHKKYALRKRTSRSTTHI